MTLASYLLILPSWLLEGLVLGTVIRWDIPHATIFILGIIFSVTVAIVGIILARTYEDK